MSSAAKALEEKNEVLEKSLALSVAKNKRTMQKVELQLDKQLMVDQVAKVNDFGPLIYNVLVDFLHAIAA